MLGNRDDRDKTDTHDDGATRVHGEHGRATGTTAGADVTSRMTGTHGAQHARTDDTSHGDTHDGDHDRTTALVFAGRIRARCS